MQLRAPILYHFTTSMRGPTTNCHVSIAPIELVGIFFTRDQLSATFGGWIAYRDKNTGADWIGVWGERKASRFRRLLRERGAIFRLAKSPPESLALRLRVTGQRSYASNKRRPV